MRMREFPPSLSMQEAEGHKPRCPLQSQPVGQCPQAVPVSPHQDPALGAVSASTGQQKHVQLRQGAEVAWHHLPSFSQIQGQRQNSHGYHKTTQNLPKHPVLLQRQSADQPMNLLGGASLESKETHASR